MKQMQWEMIFFERENSTNKVEEEVAEPEESTANIQEEPEIVEENEQAEDDVSRKHRNALSAAQNYIDFMPFSENGLFEQLTSGYGDEYTEDSAQYAIKNVEVDYNEKALEAAINYQEIMPMFDQELLD